jgi:hypothetical protein
MTGIDEEQVIGFKSQKHQNFPRSTSCTGLLINLTGAPDNQREALTFDTGKMRIVSSVDFV